MNKPVHPLCIRILRLIVCIFLLASAYAGARAQTVRGAISGIITDEKNGEPLFGANILLTGTVLGTAADSEGRFSIGNLPSGIYEVDISMMGYKKQTRRNVRVSPGQNVILEIELETTTLLQPGLLVTASKRKQHIENAPTSVDVLDIKEIQSRHATNLDEILQNTAGFGITDGQIDLRGSTGFNWTAGSRVLVMLDGHPHITGDSGGINWDSIPVEEVERVEIVKGPGSALYGSNALAGMVNIITREPTPYPETRYRLTWGFYDEPAYPEWRWTDRFLTYRIFEKKSLNPLHSLSFGGLDLSHSRQIGSTGMVISVGRKTSSGYQENGDYSRWNVTGKTKTRLSQDKTLTILGNWASDDHGDIIQWTSQDHPLEAPDSELGNRVLNQKNKIQTTFQHAVSEKLAYTVKANWYYSYWHNYFRDNQDYAKTHRWGAEAQFDYHLGRQSFTFGTEAIAHRTHSLIYGDHHTWDYAVYGEDELKIGSRWTFNMGTRFDYHIVPEVVSSSQLSPRFGLVCRPAEGTSLRLSAGRGFRAPSIAEVFANITVSGFHVVPNLNLKTAERAWSLELGARQVLSFQSPGRSRAFSENPFLWFLDLIDPGIILDGAVFWNDYNNMIDVDLNPELMAFQFINLGRARNQGAELRASFTVFNNLIQGTAGYTYVDAEDMETRKPLNYRSRHRVVTGITFNTGRFSLGWDYRYASRVEEVVNIFRSDERVPMHVMDGRLNVDMGKIHILLEAKNLGNYHYSLRQRCLEPIRHFVISLRGTL